MLPFRLSIDAHAIIRLLLLRLMIKVHTDRVVFINVWIAGDGKRARIDGSASIDHRAFRRLITGTDSVDKSFSLRPSFFFIRISHRGDVVFLPGLSSRKKKKRNKEIEVFQTSTFISNWSKDSFGSEFLNACGDAE